MYGLSPLGVPPLRLLIDSCPRPGYLAGREYAAGSHDGDELALFHFHAYAIERDGFYFFRPEVFAEVLYLNHDLSCFCENVYLL